MESIEIKLDWLKKAHESIIQKVNISDVTIILYKRKWIDTKRDIIKLQNFVNLRENEKIEAYWNPILASWDGLLDSIYIA